jgi:hypothetical protein
VRGSIIPNAVSSKLAKVPERRCASCLSINSPDPESRVSAGDSASRRHRHERLASFFLRPAPAVPSFQRRVISGASPESVTRTRTAQSLSRRVILRTMFGVLTTRPQRLCRFLTILTTTPADKCVSRLVCRTERLSNPRSGNWHKPSLRPGRIGTICFGCWSPAKPAVDRTIAGGCDRRLEHIDEQSPARRVSCRSVEAKAG